MSLTEKTRIASSLLEKTPSAKVIFVMQNDGTITDISSNSKTDYTKEIASKLSFLIKQTDLFCWTDSDMLQIHDKTVLVKSITRESCAVAILNDAEDIQKILDA